MMVTVDDFLRDYLQSYTEFNEKTEGGHPKILVELHLNADREIANRHLIEHALEHILVNSIESIYGARNAFELLMREDPPYQGVIDISAANVNKGFKRGYHIDVMDNGCGIDLLSMNLTNPDELFDISASSKPPNMYRKKGYGLNMARSEISKAGGKIYIRGTTYEAGGKLITIGDHHSKHTGTTLRIEMLNK